MTKYDQHGFLTQEWATVNINGFTELDPCCQTLLTLFPDMPHRCSDIIKPVEHSIPTEMTTLDPEGYGVAGIAGGALLAGMLIPSGGSSYRIERSVPEPSTATILGLVLVAVTVFRFMGYQRPRKRAN